MATSLSAGQVIAHTLINGLGDRVTKVFPVVVSQATLPYVAYRQVSDNTRVTKDNAYADTAHVAVAVFANSYAEVVELSESVRELLDNKTRLTAGDLVMRRCWMVSAKDEWQDDAWVKELEFECRF